jgi:chromosome segregation ATPase
MRHFLCGIAAVFIAVTSEASVTEAETIGINRQIRNLPLDQSMKDGLYELLLRHNKNPLTRSLLDALDILSEQARIAADGRTALGNIIDRERAEKARVEQALAGARERERTISEQFDAMRAAFDEQKQRLGDLERASTKKDAELTSQRREVSHFVARKQNTEDLKRHFERESKDLDVQNKALEEQNKAFDAQNKALDAQNKALEERNKALEDRNKFLDEQHALAAQPELDAQKRNLEERNQWLEGRNRGLEGRNRGLEERSRGLEERTQELLALNRDLYLRSREPGAPGRDLRGAFDVRTQSSVVQARYFEARAQNLEARKRKLEERTQELEALTQELERRKRALIERIAQAGRKRP